MISFIVNFFATIFGIIGNGFKGGFFVFFYRLRDFFTYVGYSLFYKHRLYKFI